MIDAMQQVTQTILPLTVVVLVVSVCLAMSVGDHECPQPANPQDISLCALCSDEHAGVRWIFDEDTKVFSLVSLSFNCVNEEGAKMLDDDSDECFGDVGSLNPKTLSLTGRVHMIGQKLPPRTICSFTLIYLDPDTFVEFTRHANCSTKNSEECLSDPEECHLPANCSVNDNQCQCECNIGYEDHIGHGTDPSKGLFCERLPSIMKVTTSTSSTTDNPTVKVISTPTTSTGHTSRIITSSLQGRSTAKDNPTTAVKPSSTLTITRMMQSSLDSYSPSETLPNKPTKTEFISGSEYNSGVTTSRGLHSTSPLNNDLNPVNGILKGLIPVVSIIVVLFITIIFMKMITTLIVRRRDKAKTLKYHRTMLTSSTLDFNFMPIKVDDKRKNFQLSQQSILHALNYDEHKDDDINLDTSEQLAISSLLYTDNGHSTCDSDTSQYLSNGGSLETSTIDSLEQEDDAVKVTGSDLNCLENLDSNTLEHSSNLFSANDYVQHNEEITTGSHCVQALCPPRESVLLMLQGNSGPSGGDNQNSSWESGVEALKSSSFVAESQEQISSLVEKCDYTTPLCTEYHINDEIIADTIDDLNMVNSIPNINKTTNSTTNYRKHTINNSCEQPSELLLLPKSDLPSGSQGYVTESTGGGYVTESTGGGYVAEQSTSSGYVTESVCSDGFNIMNSYVESCHLYNTSVASSSVDMSMDGSKLGDIEPSIHFDFPS